MLRDIKKRNSTYDFFPVWLNIDHLLLSKHFKVKRVSGNLDLSEEITWQKLILGGEKRESKSLYC